MSKTTTVKVSSVFNCSLERAFKTPMLCDISKVHTGFLIMPKVTHSTNDENWRKPGFSKKVFVKKTLIQKGGWASSHKVIERIENQYCKIEESDFQTWILGFAKFVGEWQTTQIDQHKILIEYTYTMHSNNSIFYTLNWIFTKFFWRI